MARILVVEDDAAQAAAVQGLLAADGHEVELLDQLAAFRARLTQPPPDVVVLDRELSDGDGLDGLRDARALDPWIDVPVVVASDRGEDGDVWAGWTAGASSYLVRPVTPQRVREVVVEQVVQQVLG